MAVRVSLLVCTDPSKVGDPNDVLHDVRCIKYGHVLSVVETSTLRADPNDGNAKCAAGKGYIHVDDSEPGTATLDLKRRLHRLMCDWQYSETDYAGNDPEGDLVDIPGEYVPRRLAKRRGYLDLDSLSNPQKRALFTKSRELTLTTAEIAALWTFHPLVTDIAYDGNDIPRRVPRG